jgi:hypothetical protein
MAPTLPTKRRNKALHTPQVSNIGRFRCAKGITKTPVPRRDGYSQIKIAGKSYLLHRTIALSFELPHQPGQNTVNHKTGIAVGGTNALDNLEWASQAEQIRHSHATNPTRKSNGPKQSKPLYGRKAGTDDEWILYDGANAAARALKVNQGSVSKCCKHPNKQPTVAGYEFKFAEATPDLPGEEWRDVAGSKAQVSSLGRYRSSRGIVTTPSVGASGYCRVEIDGKKRLIHILVYEAFVGPIPEGEEIDHGDGDPSNNCVTNLESVTHAENVRRSFEKNANRKSSAHQLSKPVLGRKVGTDDEWVEYDNLGDAADKLGVSKSSVSNCCNHPDTHKQAGGYEFKYGDPFEPDTFPGEIWRDVVLE